MINVGILGTDNSHALHFAKLCNNPDPATGEYTFPDFRVTHLFGLNPAETQKIVDAAQVPHVVDDPGEMLGQVDAVMVVFRHGGLHAQYALPFIQAGIPTWIDKPMAITLADSRLLIAEADKKGTLLTGGSTCKFAAEVLELQQAVQTQQLGPVVSGMVNFPVQLDSEYAGIHFYAAHLVEMTLQIFGFDLKSVLAVEKNGGLTVLARYESFDTVMSFNRHASQYHGLVIGEQGNLARQIDISTVYRQGFADFARMITTGQRPFDVNKLLLTTAIVNAIDRSRKCGAEIFIQDLLQE